MTAWERAIAINPADDFSTYNLGLLYLEKGDKGRAKQLFSTVLGHKGSDVAPAERDRLLALIERCK